MPAESVERPWDELRRIIDTENREDLSTFLESLGPMETARVISRLHQPDQNKLFTLLSPSDAAEVIEDVSDQQGAGLIESLPPKQAAAIIDELKSDVQADLLGELDSEDAEAILQEMPVRAAKEARQMLAYPPDTAGGMMIAEYPAFHEKDRISGVLENLQAHRDEYASYHVQYIYVLNDKEGLAGVLRMHDLLFSDRSALLKDLMIAEPLHVSIDATIQELRDFFDHHKLFGVPVLDRKGCMIGVVLPQAVEEATLKQANRRFLGVSGIVGGEEFRTMPITLRSRRRLSWLSINILLNIIAASVIAFYQDTLAAVISLAVFLPIISDMSGCSGNQAVAVSMRELTLGLVRPREMMRVLGKEASLGLINGLALGVLLGGVALLWKRNFYLGAVIGIALFLNTLVAVSLGGLLPLALKRLKLDPALVSGPILTTVTDMCGFFLVLSLASLTLPLIAV